jgi:hypothetical protein
MPLNRFYDFKQVIVYDLGHPIETAAAIHRQKLVQPRLMQLYLPKQRMYGYFPCAL